MFAVLFLKEEKNFNYTVEDKERKLMRTNDNRLQRKIKLYITQGRKLMFTHKTYHVLTCQAHPFMA